MQHAPLSRSSQVSLNRELHPVEFVVEPIEDHQGATLHVVVVELVIEVYRQYLLAPG